MKSHLSYDLWNSANGSIHLGFRKLFIDIHVIEMYTIMSVPFNTFLQSYMHSYNQHPDQKLEHYQNHSSL